MAVVYGQKIQQIYYQTSTSNKSFIDTCTYLRDTGIVRWKFPLTLIDKDLAGIDPYDPRLNSMMKARILKECMTNFWYFAREIVRIPDSGVATGIKFQLHRGNLAMYFCLGMNLNIFVDMPRQCGKTIGALVWYLWLFNFGTANSEMTFLNKKFEDSKENLRRIREIRDLLPGYLKMDASFAEDGTKMKGRNNVEVLQHPLNRNRIRTVASARNLQSAASLLRGRTTNLIYIDEFGFILHNKVIYMNMVPAYRTAANNAKRNGMPYGMVVTTTPGMLTTDEGKYAFSFKNNATPFSELWYNMSYEDLQGLLSANTDSSFTYIRYTYQQLGKSEQWFKDLCVDMGKSWDDIRREVLLEWRETAENSPFTTEDLDVIKGLVHPPIRSVMLLGKYIFNIYEDLNFYRQDPPLMGVDVSGGYGRDSSAITIVDSYTTKVTADFNCNYISIVDLARVIFEIVSAYMPNCVVNIERNGGFGASVISQLLNTSIRKNLFFTIKDRVIEERVMGAEFVKKKQKVKVYGSDSTKSERELLIEILRDRVTYHKDKITSPIIYEELKTLEVKKSGRVEHSDNGHDDQIFSWLWALYVYYYGNDLMNQWGIVKRTLKTDADLEEAVYDMGQGTETITDELDYIEDNQIQEQLAILNSAPGQKSYKQWVNEEIKKDEESLQRLLMNKAAKDAYNRQFHIDTTINGDAVQFTQIPDSIFSMMDEDDNMQTNIFQNINNNW